MRKFCAPHNAAFCFDADSLTTRFLPPPSPSNSQWGNLLTLAACYRDPILGKFVDENTLRGLFRRTIAFMGTIAQPSSALAIDLRILEGLAKDVLGMRKEDLQTYQPMQTTPTQMPAQPPSLVPLNTSFSSSTTTSTNVSSATPHPLSASHLHHLHQHLPPPPPLQPLQHQQHQYHQQQQHHQQHQQHQHHYSSLPPPPPSSSHSTHSQHSSAGTVTSPPFFASPSASGVGIGGAGGTTTGSASEPMTPRHPPSHHHE